MKKITSRKMERSCDEATSELMTIITNAEALVIRDIGATDAACKIMKLACGRIDAIKKRLAQYAEYMDVLTERLATIEDEAVAIREEVGDETKTN